MFYSVTGKVVFSDFYSIAVLCGGVAFKCLTSANTLRDIDKNEVVTLYTHLNVREDALDLFGFSTEYELEWFRLLIGVTGVGPKAALAILSEQTPEKLALCISSGDVKAITRANGVGPKIAQRAIARARPLLPSVRLIPRFRFRILLSSRLKFFQRGCNQCRIWSLTTDI